MNTKIHKDFQYKHNPLFSKVLSRLVDEIEKSCFVVSFKDPFPLKKIDKPLLVLSNHQSHLDYLLFKKATNATCSNIQTIAGKNLNFFLVGEFFRRTNAIWIERNKNKLTKQYLKLFEEGMFALLDKNIPIGLFPEGKRSRSGEVLDLKLGVIRNYLNYLIANQKAGYLVVSAIGYDGPLEVLSLMKDQSSIKKSDSFFKMLKGIKEHFKRVGAYYVGFDSPWLITPSDATLLLQDPDLLKNLLRARILECSKVTIAGTIGYFLDGDRFYFEDIALKYSNICYFVSKEEVSKEDFAKIISSLIDSNYLILHKSGELSINSEKDSMFRYQNQLLRQKLKQLSTNE